MKPKYLKEKRTYPVFVHYVFRGGQGNAILSMKGLHTITQESIRGLEQAVSDKWHNGEKVSLTNVQILERGRVIDSGR